jgi:hypothetical protein
MEAIFHYKKVPYTFGNMGIFHNMNRRDKETRTFKPQIPLNGHFRYIQPGSGGWAFLPVSEDQAFLPVFLPDRII